MKKLICVVPITDGFTYFFESPIPFYYKSKEHFVFDILEKCRDWDWEESRMEVFGIPLEKGDVENIEHSVYEFDEWFEKYKVGM